MEDRVAGVTVRVILPEISPEVAVMVDVPAATEVPRPVLLTVATDALEEVQVICVVKSRLAPSEYTPEAANCRVTPAGIFGLVGVTDMEDRIAEVTVRVVPSDINPEVEVAVMVVVPGATVVMRPLLLTVAEEVFDELQVTRVVISKLVPSEYAPKAANGWVTPAGILGLAGVTDMEDRVAEVTVRFVLPKTIPEAALMVVVPAVTAVARPLPLTVAITGFEELQATCVVTSRVVPSEYGP